MEIVFCIFNKFCLLADRSENISLAEALHIDVVIDVVIGKSKKNHDCSGPELQGYSISKVLPTELFMVLN